MTLTCSFSGSRVIFLNGKNECNIILVKQGHRHCDEKAIPTLLEPFDYEFSCRYQTKTLDPGDEAIAHIIPEIADLEVAAVREGDNGSTFMSELFSDSTNLQNFERGEIASRRKFQLETEYEELLFRIHWEG